MPGPREKRLVSVEGYQSLQILQTDNYTHPKFVVCDVRTRSVNIHGTHWVSQHMRHIQGELCNRSDDLSGEHSQLTLNVGMLHESENLRPPRRRRTLKRPMHFYPACLLHDQDEAPAVLIPVAAQLRVDRAERIDTPFGIMEVQLAR